jgi:hypothetical protein
MSATASQHDLKSMSSALFNRIAATVVVVLALSLLVGMVFAAAPTAPLDLAPGDSRSETVTITNQGDAPDWTARA